MVHAKKLSIRNFAIQNLSEAFFLRKNWEKVSSPHRTSYEHIWRLKKSSPTLEKVYPSLFWCIYLKGLENIKKPSLAKNANESVDFDPTICLVQIQLLTARYHLAICIIHLAYYRRYHRKNFLRAEHHPSCSVVRVEKTLCSASSFFYTY